MKKILSILLCAVMLLTLTACKKKEEANNTEGTTVPKTETTNSVSTPEPTAPAQPSAPTDATEPTVNDAPVQQLPMVSVALPIESEDYTAQDGATLLSCSNQYMILTMTDQEVAERITIDFLSRIDNADSTKNSLLSAASSAYTGSADWRPYQYIVKYTPKRLDSGVFSLLSCQITYTGGQVDKLYNSVNYNMVTGHALSLNNILCDGDHIESLIRLCVESLNTQKEEYFLYDDFADTVEMCFTSGINDAWYFSPEGLCFFFAPRELAPNSTGVVVAQIPYEKLTGILRDDYFPAERASAPGGVLLEVFTSESILDYTQIAEYLFETGENKLILYTDRSVYDICIDVGTFVAGSRFQEEYTLFAASSLTPGDAIVTDIQISDNACLQIRYRSGDSEIIDYVIRDPDTNQIRLISAA